MQLYQARNPKKSPLWQCVHRHFYEFVEVYPEQYQPDLGALRPIIPEVVHKFLDCGNLERGFARIRCDECHPEYLLALSCVSYYTSIVPADTGVVFPCLAVSGFSYM